MSRTLRVHKKLNPSDFRSDDEIIADIANSKGGDTFRQRDPEFEAEFKGMRERNMPGLIESSTKGFKRGVDMTQALGFGLGAWGADAVGADSVRDWAIEGMEEQFAEAEENKAFTTFGEAETFRDYADWAAGGIGELLPNVLTTIAASVATAGVGGVAAVAGFGGRKALTKLVSKELAEKFAEKGGAKYVNQMTRKELEFESRKMAGQLIRDEAAKKGVKRTADNVLGIRAKEMAAKKAAGKRLGGQLGAIGSGVGLNTGEIYGQFAEDLDNPNVSRAERVLATGGMGFLAGLLDSALPLLAVNKFLPDATKKGMMSEVMEAFPEWLRKNKKKGALLALTGGSVTEGSIEALQELLGYTAGLVDETREFSWEEVKPSLIEAGALGALGGGFFGLAGAGATMVSKDKASQQEIEEEQVNLINAKRKEERERTDNIPVITEFQVGDVFHEASTEATEDTEASVGRQMTVKEVDENGNATLHVANHDNTDQLMEVSVAEFNDHLSQAPVTRVRLEEGEKPLKIASYQDMKNDMLRSELRRLGLKKVQTDDDKAQVENLLSQVTGSPIIEQEYQGLRKEVDMERIEVLKAKVENGNTLTDVDYEDIGRLVGLYPDQTKELQTKADVALGEVTKDMSEIQDATALEEQDAQNLVTGDSIKKLNKIRKTKGGRLVIADIRRLKKLMKKQFTLTGEQSLTPVEEIQLESGRQAYPETARAYEETLNNEKSVKDAKVAELKANPKSSMKWEELLALSGLEGIYKSGTQKREGGIPASKAQLIDHINFVNGHGGKEFTHAISSKNQMALSDTPEEWRGYLSSNYSPDRLFEFIRQVEHMVSTGVLNETETKAANDAVRHAKKIVSKKGLVNYTLADKQGVPVSDIVRPVETTDVSTEVSATPPPVIKGTATVIEVDEALDIPTLKKNGTLVKSRAGNRGLAVMDKRTGEVTIRAVRGLDSSDEKSSRVDRWTVSSGESASNVLTTILAGNSIVGTNGESLTTPAAVLKQMGKTKKSGPWWLLPPTEGDKNLRNQLIPIMESLGWDKETEGKISKNVGKTTKILLAEFYNKAYEGNGVPIAWVHFDNKPDDYVWVGTRKAFDNMVRASKATHDFYTKLSTEKEYLYAAVQTATQREIQDLQNEAKEVGQPMTDAQAKTLIENPDRQEQLRKEGVEEKPAYLEANKGRFAQLLRNLKAFAKTELEESGGQPLLRHEEEHMLIGAVKASLNVHKYQNMLADLLADNRAQLRDLLYLGKVNPKGNRKFLGMFTEEQIDILMDISAGEVDGEFLSQEQNFIRKAKEFTKKNRVSPVVHIKGMQKAGQSAMGEVTSSLDKEDENGLSALDKTEDKSKEFEDKLHGRLFDSEGKLHSEIHGEIEEYKSGTYNDELSADQIGKILRLSEEEIAARLKKGEKLVLPEGQTLTDAQAIEAYLVKNSNESIIGDFLRSLIASRLTGEAKDALDNDPTLLREVNEQLIGDTEMSQQASEQLVDILTTSFNKGKADEVSVEQLESEAVSRTLGDTPVTPLLPEGSVPEGGSPIGETPTVESTPEGTGDVGASTDQVVETPTQKTVRKAKAKGVPTSVAKTKVVQTTEKTIEEVNAELDLEEKVEDVLAQTLDDSLDMERRLLDERETATPARQKEIDKWVSDRIDAVERLTQMLPAITDPKERLNILEGFASEFAVVEETTFREPEGEVITSTTVEEIVEEDGLADPGGITTINRVNRKNFKNSIMLAFNLSVEEASAVAQLMEGVAQTWAERTGRTAEEWYTEYIDGLERVPVAEQVDMGRYFNNANGQIGFAKTVRDGKPHYSAIISAFENSDVTTAMHELFHLIRMTTITEKQRITLEGWLAKKKLLPEDDGSWTVAMEEMAARAFEKYLRTGKLPTTVSEDLKAVFKDMKRWFMKAYKNLVNSPLGDVGIIPNDVINVFNEILVGADEEAIMDETIVEPKVDLTPTKKTVKFTKPRQAVSLKSFAKEVSKIFTSLDVSGVIAGVKADRVQETEGIFLEEDDGFFQDPNAVEEPVTKAKKRTKKVISAENEKLVKALITKHVVGKVPKTASKDAMIEQFQIALGQDESLLEAGGNLFLDLFTQLDGLRTEGITLAQDPVTTIDDVRTDRGIEKSLNVTRDNFKGIMGRMFGLSDEQASAFSVITDGIATTWADKNNLAPEEWYSRFIQGVQRIPREIQRQMRDPQGLDTLLQQSAYHGASVVNGEIFPYFSEDAIGGIKGTGEGAIAYGWGMYFTQDIEIARMYAENASRRLDRSKSGKLSEIIHIPEVKTIFDRGISMKTDTFLELTETDAFKKFMEDPDRYTDLDTIDGDELVAEVDDSLSEVFEVFMDWVSVADGDDGLPAGVDGFISFLSDESNKKYNIMPGGWIIIHDIVARVSGQLSPDLFSELVPEVNKYALKAELWANRQETLLLHDTSNPEIVAQLRQFIADNPDFVPNLSTRSQKELSRSTQIEFRASEIPNDVLLEAAAIDHGMDIAPPTTRDFVAHYLTGELKKNESDRDDVVKDLTARGFDMDTYAGFNAALNRVPDDVLSGSREKLMDTHSARVAEAQAVVDEWVKADTVVDTSGVEGEALRDFLKSQKKRIPTIGQVFGREYSSFQTLSKDGFVSDRLTHIHGGGLYDGMDADVSRFAEDSLATAEYVSKTMLAAGIDGIKYLDGNSRGHRPTGLNWISNIAPVNGDTLSLAFAPDVDFADRGADADTIKRQLDNVLKDFLSDWTRETIATTEEAVTELEWLVSDEAVETFDDRAYRQPSTMRIGDKDKFTYLLNQLKSGNVEVSATERKYNFVVFDDSEIWINDLEVLLQGADLQSAKALIKIGQNGQGMFSAFEGADITSAFHEMFHLTRRTSLDMDENQVLEDWLRSMGHVPEGGMWTRAMEETSARAFEAYLRSGEAPTLQLKEVFQKIAKWFKEIYSSDEFKDIGIIPDEVKKVFDEIIAGTPDSAPVHDNRTYLAQSAEQKIADSMSEGERNENLATRDGVVTVEGDPTSREGSRLAYENEVDLDKKEAVDWINVAFNTELKALLFNIQDKVKSMTPARVGQLIGQLKPDETIASIIERTESADGKTLENLPERWSNLSASKLETKFSRMESRTVTIIDQLNAEIEDHRQDFDDAFEGRSNIINNPEAMEHYNFSAKKFIDRIVSSLAHSQGLSVAKSSIEATIKGIEGQLEDRTVTRYLNKFKDIKEPALLLQAVSALDIDWSNVTAKEALDIVKNYKTNANYTALKGQTQTQSQKDALAGFGLMTDEARAFAVAYAMSHSIEMNVLRLRLSETIGRFDELKRRMKGLIGMNEEELLKKEAELIEELKEKSVLQDQIQLQLIGYEKRLKRTVALQLRKKKKIKDLEATLEQIQTQNRQYRKQLGVVGTFRGAPGEHFHSWNPKTGEFEFPKFEYSGKNSKAYESAFRNNEIYLKDKSNEAKDPVLYATVERTNTQLKYSIFKTEAQNVKMRTVSFLISSSQKIFRAIGYNEGIRLSNKMLALSRDILVHGQRFDALAQKWESLESDFRKAAGFTSALAFKRDVLVPIYASLESEIGILSEQGGLNHGYKVLQSRLAKLDTGGTVNEAQLKKAFDKYFIQTKSISQELNALREATGSTITDPRTQVDATESFRAEDPAIVAKAKIKGKLKDTKRDLERLVGLDLGWITMPRMIKTGELSRVVDLMFANGWGTQSTVRNVPDLYWWQEVRTTPDGKEVVVNTIEETFENPDITLEEKLETVRAGFNKVDASKSEDLDLYTSFYLPIIEHHTSLFENATTDEVRQAWERSGGDVVNFSIILANNVRASDKTQTEQVHRYLNTFLNQFQTYAKIAKNSKDQADWTDTSTNNSFMADARTTRNIPQEYVTYTDFDKGSMSRHVMKLVSMQHFGKNFETFDAIYNSLILNIEKDIADASRKGDNPRVVELGEKLKKARKERSNYMNWYTKSETSPNQEVRLFSEVMRTAAIAMLAQPKSAMNNLVSLTDFFVTFKGVNKYSSSAVKSAISNMVKSPFWSFLETFGIQRTINRESKIIMDVTANLHRQSVSLKEQVAERGFGDQSEDDTSSKAIRTLRKAQRVISHPFGTFVKEGDRQEIALSANIFDYSARASNAAIAEGQMEAYNMMIADLQSMDDAISVDFDRLSKKDQERLLKKAGINVDTYHYLNNRWFDMSGQTMSDLVKDVRTRREAGKPALSEPMIHNMVMIAMDEVAMNADVNTRPSAFMTGMGPTATLLLGWPVRKMNQLGAAAVTEEGEIQYKLSLKFIANMSFYSSIGIAFTLLTDIYDEEFRGRASSLRTIEGTPSNMMLAAIQRAARIGSGGLGLELLSQTLIHTDSGLGQRGISADRIVAVSMLNNAVRALANAWQQGGVSWQTVGAPLTQAFTVSAVHYMEVANHVTGGVLDGAPLVGDMFEWQRANTERVTIGNILRREGNKHQIELRKMGAGSPTPIGMHVRNMENAMYAGNQKDFIKHYKYAIQAAIDAGEPDPARRVYSAWTGRNPATVFKSPTEGMEKMPMLLADMRDRDQARRVMSAITKYQQHTAIIKPARKSTSVASSARKRMEALGFRLG